MCRAYHVALVNELATIEFRIKYWDYSQAWFRYIKQIVDDKKVLEDGLPKELEMFAETTKQLTELEQKILITLCKTWKELLTNAMKIPDVKPTEPEEVVH